MKPTSVLPFRPARSLAGAFKSLLLVASAIVISGQQASGQSFVDDFDSGDINDRWVVQRNAVGTVEMAQEDGHGVVTAMTANANGGLASITTFDPLADGIYVKFVITEIIGGPNANGFLIGVVDDNSVFHRNTNNFGIAAFGQEARTASGGGFSLIVGDRNAAAPSDFILDEGEAVDRASFEDGFTVTLTADVDGWSYLIEGLQDVDLVDQTYENMGTWADAGTTFAEIFGQDNEWHVLHGDQSPGEKITRFDQISLGNPKPASDPDIRVTSRVDLGQLPTVPEIHEGTVSVRNAGEAQTLEVSGVEIGGSDADHFAVAADQFPLTVAPGESSEFTFTVNSLGETGGFESLFTLVNNDPAPEEDSRIMVAVAASVLNLNGPAAHYPMDEEAGTDMRDITGFGRNGQYGEGVTLGAAGLAGGTSLQVAGGTQATVNGRAFEEGTFEEFSASLWFQADDVTPTGTLIANGLDNSPIFALLVSEGELSWFVDSAPDFTSSGGGLEAGKVHHAVVTYSADETILYVDGEEKGSGATALPDIDPSAPILIGAFGPLGFAGSIDDVQIYNRVIAPEDVQFLFSNPGVGLGTSGPVDSDGDGLSDEDEVNVHKTDPLIADTDGDDLNDGDEVTAGSNPLVIDTDGGGAWDGYEVAQGTDPTLASDDPALWTVRTLKSRTALSTLTVVDEVIAEASFSDEIIKQHAQLNFLGTGAFGNFDDDVAFDNIEAIEQNVDDFAVIATSEIFIDEQGTYTFGFNSDDGGRLTVGGIEVAVFASTRGANDSVGSLVLSPGFYTVEALMFERAGGSSFEVFWDPEPGEAITQFDSDRHQLLTPVTVSRADTDGDQLDDNWENAIFGDLSRDGTGDDDSDGLTDLDEYERSTDPSNPDTDGDGVNDGPEVNQHSTDPLDADSDDDLRTDGEEINGDPSSNPLKEDTDDDGFRDGFEVAQNSDPNDPASLPADRLGEPDQSYHVLQGLPTFSGFRGGADLLDVTFRVSIDFEAFSSPTGEEGVREMIWESGGGTVGFSLVYEEGNRLVLRAAGSGGNVVAVVDYALTPDQLAAGSLPVIWTFDVNNGNPDAAQTIALYVDGALAGSDSQALGGDWTGTDGAAFGIGTASFAAEGGNTPLRNGADFASGTIDLDHGLQMFIDQLFTADGGGPVNPPVSERFDTPTIVLTEGQIAIGWLAAQDVGYRVEFSTDLENWTAIEDIRFSVDVNDATLADTNADRIALTNGYYRVVLLP